MSTLFFTAANRPYWHFAPLYLYFVLSANPDWVVEIAIEDAEAFKSKKAGAISVLERHFPGRFKITDVTFGNRIPGLVRFLEEPTFGRDRDYVYIGDIDILVLDGDIEEAHVRNMKKNELPFSNKIRPFRESDAGIRLTGLHFAPMSLQYPLPDISDIDISAENALRGADEHILYQIMLRKGVMVSKEASFRPEHGIHIGASRHPFGRRADGGARRFDFEAIRKKDQILAWSNIQKPIYRKKLLDRFDDSVFRELYFELDVKARNLIMILDNIVHERFEEFYHEAQKYIIGLDSKKSNK